MTKTASTRVIGKCSNGHVVNATPAEFVSNCKVLCGCGAVAIVRFMDATYNAEKACNARCEGATGPACDCQCGGENHGGRHVFH